MIAALFYLLLEALFQSSVCDTNELQRVELQEGLRAWYV